MSPKSNETITKDHARPGTEAFSEDGFLLLNLNFRTDTG